MDNSSTNQLNWGDYECLKVFFPHHSKEKVKTEWDNSSQWEKWTFSVANDLLKIGQSNVLQLDDLFALSDHDHTSKLLRKLKRTYATSRAIWFVPRLIVAMFRMFPFEAFVMAFYTIVEGAIRLSLPVVLKLLLEALHEGKLTNDYGTAYGWAGLLSGLALVQTIVHHILFFFAMRMGWNWKSACTSLIYDHLFELNGGTLSTFNTGTLVNLISNDVAKFEDFSVFACFFWCSLLEVFGVLLILISYLNVASGFAGVGVTLLFIPLQIHLSKQFASLRTQTARATDQRVRYTSEVIDGSASVKSFAWETPFFTLINSLRIKEMSLISRSQSLKAINQGLYYASPPIAGFAVFAIYWGMGYTITIPLVFATLSLLQTLRMSIGRQWTRSIETGSEAFASAMRIERFLAVSPDSRSANNNINSHPSSSSSSPTTFVASTSTTTSSMNNDPLIQISNANFSYFQLESPFLPQSNQTTASSSSSSSTPSPSPPSPTPSSRLSRPTISNISLSLSRGQLLMVVGPVGAGKSTLLQAILGEVNPCSPSMPSSPSTSTSTTTTSNINSTTPSTSILPPGVRVAYCAQKPWILAATVRANILVSEKPPSSSSSDPNHEHESQSQLSSPSSSSSSSSFHSQNFKTRPISDPTLYSLAIETCRLVNDLDQWTAYDNTEVGERGISVSGGQKARIALARAVYSDSEVYLLDDPLSACDAHVGKALFFECIMTALRERNKAIVLVTHQLQYLPYADSILVLNKEGEQVFYGGQEAFQSELKEMKFPFLNLNHHHHHHRDRRHQEEGGEEEEEEEEEIKENDFDSISSSSSSSDSESESDSVSISSTIQKDLKEKEEEKEEKEEEEEVEVEKEDNEVQDDIPLREKEDGTLEDGDGDGDEKVEGITIEVEEINIEEIEPKLSINQSSLPISVSKINLPHNNNHHNINHHHKKMLPKFNYEKSNALRLESMEKKEIKRDVPSTPSSSSSSSSSSSFSSSSDSTQNNQEQEDQNKEKQQQEKQEKKEKQEKEFQRQIISSEDRVEGGMSSSLFWKYLKSGGIFKGLSALFMAVLSQVLLMITDYWLKWWAQTTFAPSQRNIEYIIVYAGLTLLCCVMGFWRAQAYFKYTLGASSNMHENALWAVMHSPMQFFIANPTGRILNRFSRDQSQCDEALPVTLFDLLQCTLFCLSAVILAIISIPWFLLFVPGLLLIFIYLRNKYICSQREIKRIEAITRSPIYADFSATLEGTVTLRASGLKPTFTHLFQSEIDDNGRAWFSFLMCARWLGFRLDMLSAIVLIVVSFLAVALTKTVDIGLIGYALVYSLSLSGLFQWTVRQSAEVEAQLTSVERIYSYGDLPLEPGYRANLTQYRQEHGSTMSNYLHSQQTSLQTSSLLTSSSSLSISTPPTSIGRNSERTGGNVELTAISSSSSSSSSSSKALKPKGEVQIIDLTVRYRLDLPPVLQGLNLHIPAGCKIGICGRTGSGKSSLLLSLLRLNLISQGDILVDGESLLTMDLEQSRSTIAMIPQDPHLFSGTVRFNLDPFNMYSDEQVWDALKDAHIEGFISKDPLGLSMKIEESGKNLSVGQRQLLSLARAILRQCKIVLMDEVTASIDYLTDTLIQQTIRECEALKSSTIITIAHRLRTIADSDLIAVVSDGKISELGTPFEFLKENNKSSQFYQLAMESNEFDAIYQLAQSRFNKETN